MLEKVLTSIVMEMWDIKFHELLVALNFSLFFFPHSLCGKENGQRQQSLQATMRKSLSRHLKTIVV